ncbi:adenosylcobinamide-phosphate synthase CbiB [Actomonas aquatica]|uniref:Cobalamin biosynthesis protein CobD n=1 Tax=Actomonas aquatica TaxID=2866162 RepID=A0ABZ1CGM4_9BACT|nr:adenosylcobinamide-phosphate synthase CbiB [Opitutus sp. WL0086]WRQ89724.1 adenosylcobinamide-phosphate synthase CbiB [Opitutus sp. WL0086]
MDVVTIAWAALGTGYALDLLLGDPRWLPHPIVGYGRAIRVGERWLNRGDARARFVRGAVMATVLVAGTAALWAGLEQVAAWAGAGWLWAVGATGVFFGLANRTLIAEGRAVFVALDESLAAGRARLAWIVGRDTADLDAQQVRTAVAETMAENLSDGVVAPLFFWGIAGVPGMMAYKMVNTLDSMIGHRDARYEFFGKWAARLDDVANFVPARLTAGLMVLLSGRWGAARIVWRDGRAHESVNAGYPEAAMAGIFRLRCGGPTRYDGEWVEKPWIGDEARPIGRHEIHGWARLNQAVCFTMLLMAGGLRMWICR